MRPTTSAEATRLAAPARVTHVRATLERADGAWIDVTDWLLGVTLTEDRDAGAISGTFRFRREARRDANAFTTGVAATSEANLVVSLAPLVTLSPANTFSGSHSSGTGFLYDPLVVPFRGVRLDVAVTAPGETPGTGSAPAWTRVFDGVIDDPSWGGTASVLEVAVRDLAARLQDTLIEEERDYGSAGGTPIEGVLQQILADNGFPVTVAVLGDTEGWSLKPYTQARGVSVWDAVRQLALQMGWDFRYWRHADGTYRPTLLEPRRADDPATAPDVTFTSDEVIDIPRLSLNGSDVRNAGELLYIDRATEEEATVTASAPDSIAEFGRRAFGIDERQQYPRTAAEAQQMLDAAVADLATPYVEQDAVVRFWWPLQLGDAVRFDLGAGSILPGTTFDTNRYYDTAIAFAVTALRHELTLANGGLTATTTLSLRGRSVGAFRRWLVLIGEAPTAASAAIVQQQLVQALVPSPLTLLAPGAPVTWSAMPSADTEVFGGTWLRQRASLNGVPAAALSVQVETPGAASATFRPQWAPTTAPTPADADWADLLAPGAAASVGAGGAQTHPLAAVDPAAVIADETDGSVLVRVVGAGGDGSASPVVGSINLLFGPSAAPPVDPDCVVVSQAVTASDFADLAAWAAAGGANEERYAGTPSANSLTSDGLRMAGGVLASDDFLFADAWHPTGPAPTTVLARFRFRGVWTARSSKWRLCLGAVRGANDAALELNLWNHAVASNGVAKDRLWIKHSVPNPDFGHHTTTPGPLAATVFTGSDYEVCLLVDDRGTPDGAGWHDVRMAVWGGPVDGAATKWLDVTGKMQPVGFSNPKTFALSYIEAPRPNVGAFSPIYGFPVAYGAGPSEKAGTSGDYLTVRGVLLAQDTCVGEFVAPTTTAPPPAPLALPAVEERLSVPLLFKPGTYAAGPVTDTVTVPGDPISVYQGVELDGANDSANTAFGSAQITSGTNGFQATAQAGAAWDDVGPYSEGQYVVEASVTNIADTNWAGAAVSLGGSLYRKGSCDIVPGTSGAAGRYWTVAFAVANGGNPDPPKTATITDPVVKRYMAPEGYP